jgi:magnesium transporter
MPKLKEHNLHEPVSMYMGKDFVSFHEDQTVGRVLESLWDHRSPGEILYLYVTDLQNRLVGVVPVRKIITSDPQTSLSSIMVSPPVAVSASQTVLQACELFSEHRFLALPVVDNDYKIVGTIDINLFTEEVVSLTHQRQLNNVFQLIGVHVSLEKIPSSWASFKDRFPWLLCNVSSGVLCAFIAGRYELLLSQVAILTMFLTVVLALAESVSIQSMTLTLQVFLQQQTSWRRIFSRVQKEIFTSSLIGAASGCVVGLVAFLWRGDFLQGLAVGISIWLAMMTACLLGVILPTLIRKLRIDPKIASGPIVLAFADIATLLFYFSIANWFLS